MYTYIINIVYSTYIYVYLHVLALCIPILILYTYNHVLYTYIINPQHMRGGVIVVSCLSVCVCYSQSRRQNRYHPRNKHQYRENNTLFSLKKLKFSRIDSKTDTKLKSLCTSATVQLLVGHVIKMKPRLPKPTAYHAAVATFYCLDIMSGQSEFWPDKCGKWPEIGQWPAAISTSEMFGMTMMKTKIKMNQQTDWWEGGG